VGGTDFMAQRIPQCPYSLYAEKHLEVGAGSADNE
jgi:hypothetical protein